MRPTLQINPRTGQQIFKPRINAKATRAATGIGSKTSGLDSMKWNSDLRDQWNSNTNAQNDPTRGLPAAMPQAPVAAVPADQGAALAPVVPVQASPPQEQPQTVRSATPIFDAINSNQPLGMRAAPLALEGFKDGGSPTPNIPFLANEVGAEAFYNLATEQLEPLGNGQPGVYTTSAPGIVVPNAVLPEMPRLSIPEFPALCFYDWSDGWRRFWCCGLNYWLGCNRCRFWSNCGGFR